MIVGGGDGEWAAAAIARKLESRVENQGSRPGHSDGFSVSSSDPRLPEVLEARDAVVAIVPSGSPRRSLRRVDEELLRARRQVPRPRARGAESLATADMVSLLATALIALGALLVIGVGVSRPTQTIIPLYAALVPIGGIFGIPVPLPPPFNSLSSLVGAIVILSTVLHILLYGRGRIPSLPVAVWFIFLSWSAMTAFWAQLPTAAVEELRLALPLVLLMAAVGVLPSEGNDVGAVRVAIVIGGAVIGAYALALLSTGSALPIHGTAQRFSIASDPSQTNPNQLAAGLILPLIFSLDLVLWGHGPYLRAGTWKLVGAIGALLVSAALIMTGSRGGVIAAMTAFLLILFFTWRWHPEVRRSVIRLVVGVFVTVALLGFASFAATMLSPEGRWADLASIDPVQRLASTKRDRPAAQTSGPRAMRPVDDTARWSGGWEFPDRVHGPIRHIWRRAERWPSPAGSQPLR